MNKLLIHAWSVYKHNGIYYLPYTHWVYLQEIVKYYDEICLLSPVFNNEEKGQNKFLPIDFEGKVTVFELPPSNGYISAIKHFGAYYKGYKQLKDKYTEVYVRYPIPFGWLSKVFFKGKRRIIHFVGDPIDATKVNPNFSKFKKRLLVGCFLPENSLYMWACKGANVYTNGHHLKAKVAKHGIEATALISSTLTSGDFFLDPDRQITSDNIKMLYVGYLRKAKGVEVIIRTFNHIANDHAGATLTIVGAGEFERELRTMAHELGLNNRIKFAGHVDNRAQLNSFFREHNVFCFASLSEGSPRVILEAMANGINVVSTPVGSLPSVFSDEKDIMFAGFNDDRDFAVKINKLVHDNSLARIVRTNAMDKVKGFTIEAFIRTIFE